MTSDSHNLYSIQRNREVIFLESLRELQNRKGKKSPYYLVRQGAILRFLLVEGEKFYEKIKW